MTTMNMSPLSMFPSKPREEELLTSVHMLGGGEKVGDGCSMSRRVVLGLPDFPELDDSGRPEAGGCGGGGGGGGGSGSGKTDAAHRDVVDLLPSDPFGMNLEATFTAIAGWIEDYQAASELDSQSDEDAVSVGFDYDSVARFNFLMLGWEPGGRVDDAGWERSFYDGGLGLFGVDEMVDAVESEGDGEGEGGSEGEAPHDAIEFAMKYLDLLDLLSMESVCRTTRYWARNNVFLWRNIHIVQPLSDKIADDALIHLTGRAEGSLESLRLVDCTKITDDCVKVIMQSNPTLKKLCVPGCTRLSMDGITNSLKAFNSSGSSQIKCLRVGELYGVTPQNFEELRHLLGLDKDKQHSNACKRRIYPLRSAQVHADDGCGPIDIEICSRCQNPRILYDCPVESCQGKPPTPQGCRACTFCIKRCCLCGICINSDTEYEETFSLELICATCWKNKATALDTRDASFHNMTK